MSLAWRQFESVLTQAQLVPSGEILEDIVDRRHYSQNVNSLTHFTNPLTKYATLKIAVKLLFFFVNVSRCYDIL